MKKTIRTITISFFALLMTCAAAFTVPSGSVAAAPLQDVTTTDTTSSREDWVKTRLERQYERLQDWSARQSDKIAKLDTLTEKIQERLDALNEKGLDTTALGSALAAFNASIPAIKESHDAAAAILDVHAGFGEDGKVTDLTFAREALDGVREGLQATREMMKDAARTLKNAVRDFRAANPLPTPASTEAPAD
jgi:hypothetical protein